MCTACYLHLQSLQRRIIGGVRIPQPRSAQHSIQKKKKKHTHTHMRQRDLLLAMQNSTWAPQSSSQARSSSERSAGVSERAPRKEQKLFVRSSHRPFPRKNQTSSNSQSSSHVGDNNTPPVCIACVVGEERHIRRPQRKRLTASASKVIPLWMKISCVSSCRAEGVASNHEGSRASR